MARLLCCWARAPGDPGMAFWPGREVTPRGTLWILGRDRVATGCAILLERARVLDLAFAPETGTLSLLFLPTYFATSAGWGLLRSAADFVLTGLLVSSAVILLVPAWRQLCARRSPRGMRGLVWAVLAAGSVAQLGWIEVVQALVVRNANPLLIGLDSPFFTVPFLALHVGMLLLLFPLVVALLLGWERWFRGDTAGWVGLAAATAAIAARGIVGDASLVTTLWGVLVPVLGVAMRPAVRSPAFSRRVLTGLLALTWFAGVQSTGLERVYNAEKEEVRSAARRGAARAAGQLAALPARDLVDEIAADRGPAAPARRPRADRSNLAFEIWARTLLPSQNFGCRVALRDDEGRLISEFDIGLPYEPTPLRNWRSEAPMRRTTEGRGDRAGHRAGTLPGLPRTDRPGDLKPVEGDCSRLIIDLPYAAAEGSIPLEENVPVGLRLLGETPDRDLAPRRTFDEAVLIGHPSDGRVLKASSPVLVGLRLDDLPAPGVWTRQRLDGQLLHVARVERDRPRTGRRLRGTHPGRTAARPQPPGRALPRGGHGGHAGLRPGPSAAGRSTGSLATRARGDRIRGTPAGVDAAHRAAARVPAGRDPGAAGGGPGAQREPRGGLGAARHRAATARQQPRRAGGGADPGRVRAGRDRARQHRGGAHSRSLRGRPGHGLRSPARARPRRDPQRSRCRGGRGLPAPGRERRAHARSRCLRMVPRSGAIPCSGPTTVRTPCTCGGLCATRISTASRGRSAPI